MYRFFLRRGFVNEIILANDLLKIKSSRKMPLINTKKLDTLILAFNTFIISC